MNIEQHALEFVRWYIVQCNRMKVPCDGVKYDLPDAYSDWMENFR